MKGEVYPKGWATSGRTGLADWIPMTRPRQENQGVKDLHFWSISGI